MITFECACSQVKSTSSTPPASSSPCLGHRPTVETEALDFVEPVERERTVPELDMDEDYRHWSPESQPIAPADVVVRYINEGWRLHDRVFVEVYIRHDSRRVELLYFTLLQDDERLSVPVVINPIALRLIRDHGLRLFRVTATRNCRDPHQSIWRNRLKPTQARIRLQL